MKKTVMTLAMAMLFGTAVTFAQNPSTSVSNTSESNSSKAVELRMDESKKALKAEKRLDKRVCLSDEECSLKFDGKKYRDGKKSRDGRKFADGKKFRDGKRGDRKSRMEMALEGITLNAEQKAKIDKLNAEMKQKRAEMRAKADVEKAERKLAKVQGKEVKKDKEVRERMMKNREEIQASYQKELKKILTSDQFSVYTSNVEKMRAAKAAKAEKFGKDCKPGKDCKVAKDGKKRDGHRDHKHGKRA